MVGNTLVKRDTHVLIYATISKAKYKQCAFNELIIKYKIIFGGFGRKLIQILLVWTIYGGAATTEHLSQAVHFCPLHVNKMLILSFAAAKWKAISDNVCLINNPTSENEEFTVIKKKHFQWSWNQQRFAFFLKTTRPEHSYRTSRW